MPTALDGVDAGDHPGRRGHREGRDAREIGFDHLRHGERADVGSGKPGDCDRNLLRADAHDINGELRVRAR